MNQDSLTLGKRARRLRVLTAMLLPVPALTMPAYAQEAAGPAAEADSLGASSGESSAHASETAEGDILVTATRKSEALSRVPASVVAMDQLKLDQMGIRSIQDIARVTPGVTFGQSAILYGTGQTSISIRGVDSVSGIPTTGIYIDDTPLQTRVGVSPSLSNAYPNVFDLERVEVLRGPQGTLFGSGSVGGAIRFIMPAPEYSDLSLYARSELSTTKHGSESYEAGLAGGAPIVEDKVGFRASVSYRHDGGYIDRLDRYTHELSEEDINSGDSFTARLAVGARLGDNFTITPSIFYQHEQIDDGSRFELATSDRASGDLKLSLSKLPESHDDEFYLPAVKMTLDFPGMSLVSDTSYFDRRTRTLSDDTTLSLAFSAGITGGAFLPGFEDYTPFTDSHTKQTAFTQELRLQDDNQTDRFNWIVGLFYQRSFVQDQYAGNDPRLLDVINIGQEQIGEPPFASLTESFFGTELYQGQYSVFQRNTHRDRQAAAYAQADFEILPRLKLTAGARYTIAQYEYEGFTAGPVYATDGRTDTAETTSRTLTPKVGASFQADRNNLFYVSASKGVRGPGVAPPVGANCAEDAAAIGFDPFATLTVDPDSIWSYEAGSKNRLFGGRMAIDFSAYHIEWKDVQTLLSLPLCTIYTTLNLGDAKIDGFDLAVSVRPLEGLSLGASLAYTNARYTTDIGGPDGTIIRQAGEPLSVAPWSIQLNGEYSHPVGDAELYGRADFTYNSHNDKPVDVNSPLVDPTLPRAPETSLLDLRFGVRFEVAQQSDLDVSLFINNVTNSQPLLSLYHETPDSTWYRSGTFRPRTVGLTATLVR
jgi:outer membrane receptor protein involved in Fe transport